MRGNARFGTSELALQILADVKAGIIRSLSVGYQLTKELAHVGQVIKFAWAPYEVSVVGIPADSAAGFNRSYSKGNTQMQNTQNTQDENTQQSRSQRRSEYRAVEAERERAREITAMGNQFPRFLLRKSLRVPCKKIGPLRKPAVRSWIALDRVAKTQWEPVVMRCNQQYRYG